MGRIVIAAYKPKSGQQEALRRLIVDHVATLRREGLVTDRAPITMEAQDGTIVEVFEWKSAAAIEAAHTNPTVGALWGRYAEICDYIPVGRVPEAAQMFSEFTPVEGVRRG
jgi:quinol monooxygenase YgiN